MARLLFPDAASVDRVQATAGTALLSASGATAVVYLDEAGTQVADITNPDGSALATAGTLILDNQSRLPEFLGPTSGATVLWTRVDGGAPVPVRPTVTARLDAHDLETMERLDAQTADVEARLVAQDADVSARIAPAVRASQTLSFESCRAATVGETFGTTPRYMDTLDDGYLYGAMSGALYRATSETGPWALVFDFVGQTPAGGIKPTGDGEVIVARATEGLWKSTGWATNPLTATWRQVLNTGGSQVVEFTWDTHPASGGVIATSYDTGADMSKSRYVWRSGDNGNTFAVIFDKQTAHPTLDPTTSHMHLAKFDPRWSATTPRIWVSYHKTTADPTNAADPLKRLIYSDDNGATWTTLSTVDQPVTGISVERGMIFTSDTDPTALNIVERTANPASMTVGLLFRRRANTDSLFGWGNKAIYGTDGMVHVAFRSSVAGHPGGIVTTDGYRSREVLTVPATSGSDQVDFVDLVLYKDRLLGTYYQTASSPGVALRLRADQPRRGAPAPQDNGLDGGSAGNLSVAAGLNANASGFRTAVFGPNGKAGVYGVAVGEGASAPIRGVAIGQAARAALENGVAIGQAATADSGTTVGWSADSTGDGTAIGTGAQAILGEGVAVGTTSTAALQSVAVGRIANASGDNAVAVGRGATASAAGAVAIGRASSATFASSVALGLSVATTATSQLAIGTVQIEQGVSASPATPGASKVRLALRLNGSVLEWVARFPNGQIKVLATDTAGVTP